MRIFFACLMMSATVAGCYDHHGLDGIEPPPVPMGDAGFPMPEDDAGWVLPEPDSGSIVMEDAGSHTCAPGPNYYLNLGSAPLSSVVMAGEMDVPSVGITLSTPPDTGMTYTAFAILGRGDTDGTFRSEHFRDVVTSCSIFDGEIRLGGGVPDERGLILVGGFSNHLDLGGSANLRIECDTDTDVAQLMGDRYVVALNGLVRDVDPVTVTDDHGCERLSVWGRSFLDQLESDDPLVIITVIPDVCEAVDVPADGSGRVIVRVEGGGDMAVPQDADFVAFSVIIENYTSGSVTAETVLHASTASEDCTVQRPDASFTNECDASNGFAPSPGSCGGGSCGVSCGVSGPVLASGTSTRFTMFAHTRASGVFQIDMGIRSPWIAFRDTAGSLLSPELVIGNTGPSPIATITVP